MSKRIKLDPDLLKNDAEDQPSPHPIHLLPNEILIKIINYLNFYDRNSVSLVCKRWLDIASTQSTIMKHPFVLKDFLRIDQPPVTVLTNSERQFPYLWVEGNLGNLGYSFNFLKLLNSIGRNVRCLYCDYVPNDVLVMILRKCPNLETLKLKHERNSICNPEKIAAIRRSLKTIIIDNDYKLTGKNIKRFETYVHEFKNIVENFIIKKISFKSEELNLAIEHAQESSLIPKFEVHNEMMQVADNINRFMNFEVHNLNLMKGEPLQLKHISYISSLSYEIPNLGIFSGLKILRFSVVRCTGYHNPEILQTVESLFFEQLILCSKCLAAKLESFPNLKTLAVKANNSISSEHIQILSAKASNVSKLILEIRLPMNEYIYHMLNGFSNLKELQLLLDFDSCSYTYFPLFDALPTLESFHLKLEHSIPFCCDETNIFAKIFDGLTTIMPNLIELTIETDFLAMSEMGCILRKFPQLKKFRLRVNPNNIDDESLEKFSDMIIKHGQKLITVELHAKQYKPICLLSKTQARAAWVDEMFLAMGSLKKIIIAKNGVIVFTRNETHFYHKDTLDDCDFNPFWLEQRCYFVFD